MAVKKVDRTKRKESATHFSANPTGWRDPGKIVQCRVELQDNNTGLIFWLLLQFLIVNFTFKKKYLFREVYCVPENLDSSEQPWTHMVDDRYCPQQKPVQVNFSILCTFTSKHINILSERNTKSRLQQGYSITITLSILFD